MEERAEQEMRERFQTEFECYIEPYHTLARAVAIPSVGYEAGQSHCGEGLEQERGVGKMICARPNGSLSWFSRYLDTF